MKKEYILLMLIFAVLASLPIFLGSYTLHILILCLVYSVITSNWDISIGYGGLLNFAQPTLFAIGVYSSGIIIKQYALPAPLGLMIAPCFAMGASLFLGVPALRLKGIYLGLLTYAFSTLFFEIISIWTPVTGGTYGLVNVPGYGLFDALGGMLRIIPYYYTFLGVFIASTLFLYKIVNSKVGLALTALRDSEEYAISRGVNPYRYRLLAYVLSAAFTGIVGSVYVHYLQVASVEIGAFSLLVSIMAMLFVGGIGTIYGPIIGSFVITLGSEYLRGIVVDSIRLIIIALAMIATVILFPGGLAEIVRVAWNHIRVLFEGTKPEK